MSARSTAAFSCSRSDVVSLDRSAWRVVTKVAPTEEQWADLELAWIVCAAVSSNAIVLVGDQRAVGIGAGQQNRVDSARIAATRAAGRAARGSVRERCVLPVPRRPRRRRGRRCCRCHPARRVGPGRRGDRRCRRARPGHGLHRRAPLPPLTRTAGPPPPAPPAAPSLPSANLHRSRPSEASAVQVASGHGELARIAPSPGARGASSADAWRRFLHGSGRLSR